jgi:hypothetical protein
MHSFYPPSPSSSITGFFFYVKRMVNSSACHQISKSLHFSSLLLLAILTMVTCGWLVGLGGPGNQQF